MSTKKYHWVSEDLLKEIMKNDNISAGIRKEIEDVLEPNKDRLAQLKGVMEECYAKLAKDPMNRELTEKLNSAIREHNNLSELGYDFGRPFSAFELFPSLQRLFP